MDPRGGRRLWLDWQRGLAVVCMVVWHTWDSWHADVVATTELHRLVHLVGGMAAPAFLYMAGLSQVLGDDALARKGVAPGARRGRALRRAGWLLCVAYLFRIAEYLLGGAWQVPGGWRDLLRVDVLNVIAVSLLASATWATGAGRRARVALSIVAAIAVVALAPVVAGWSHAPSRVLDYLYSEWPRGNFCLFPWAAFCFAGAAAGSLVGSWARAGRGTGWLVAGGVLLAGGWASDALPPFFSHQDFWHTSPSWFAMRLGIVLATTGALQLLPTVADRALAPLRTIGRHSLLVYFLSVEIPYGASTRVLHGRLGADALVAGIGAMLVVAWAVARAVDGLGAARDRAAVAGAEAPHRAENATGAPAL